MIFKKQLENKEIEVSSKNTLNNKIEEFIKWAEENAFTEYPNYKEENVEHLKKLINKMANWYEMKFPEKLIDEIVNKDVLPDLNELFDYKNDSTFKFSTSAFFDSLSRDEIKFFTRQTYKGTIYTNIGQLEIANSGKIMKATNFYHTLSTENGEEKHSFNIDLNHIFEKFTINEIEKLADILNLNFNYKSIYEVRNKINAYKLNVEFKNRLLDCVMYKLIENKNYHNNVLYGSIRAFLFAKEFGRDINIPIKYSFYSPSFVDKEYYANFIRLYVRNGGNLNNNCYPYYFEDSLRNLIKHPLCAILIDFCSITNLNLYTEEEQKLLYQRMIDSLNNRQNKLSLKKNTENN